MKNLIYIQLIIYLTSIVSCSKEVTLNAIREGKYRCNGDYHSYCRSCIPQDTQYSFIDGIGTISFKGDSIIFENNYTMWKLNNDSFVYDRGPGYPGIYYSLRFFGEDSFNFRYVQSTLAIGVYKNSYCKKNE